MSPHTIIDPYNLTITLLITIAYQCCGFFIAWTLQFDKITDFTDLLTSLRSDILGVWSSPTGGSNFFLLALITLLTGGTYYTRNIVASVLVMIWSARLAGFLLFRVLKTGSDTRFDEMRSQFFKFAGFWVFQIIWVWTVSLPTVILNSPAVSDPARGGVNPPFGTSRDIAGVVIFSIGLFWEAVGDVQKYMFKSSKPPKGQPCTKGLWYFSRHPPYFGEIILHWGLWMLCLSPSTNDTTTTGARRAQYAALASPLLTMALLLFLSGLPTAEKPTAKKYFLMSYSPDNESSNSDGTGFSHPEPKDDTWSNYKSYLNKTSILIPFPPALYRPLPKFVKQYLLLDLPMFNFDEKKDGREALEEERKKRSDA